MALRRTLTLGGSLLRYSSQNSRSIEMPRVPPRTERILGLHQLGTGGVGFVISPTFTTASSVVAISMPEATVSIRRPPRRPIPGNMYLNLFPERLVVTQSVARQSRFLPEYLRISLRIFNRLDPSGADGQETAV